MFMFCSFIYVSDQTYCIDAKKKENNQFDSVKAATCLEDFAGLGTCRHKLFVVRLGNVAGHVAALVEKVTANHRGNRLAVARDLER